MDRFSTTEFATLVRRFSIRSTVLPPAAMVMLADDDDVADLAPLRYVRSITAPLSPLSARRVTAKFGVTVLNSYGQAEVGEVIGWTAADAHEHPDKVGGGRPHAGVGIKVTAEDGTVAPEGSTGELLVRPPRMASGYAGGENLDDRIDQEGYVRTGDYAHVDEDGFVWIEGRVSDLINRGGNKVFPEQVEEVLRLSPNVREAAVVGVPDDRLGEVPVAYVVGSASGDELERLCRDHLVPYRIPVAFHHIDALPRSEVGKILRRALVGRDARVGDVGPRPTPGRTGRPDLTGAARRSGLGRRLVEEGPLVEKQDHLVPHLPHHLGVLGRSPLPVVLLHRTHDGGQAPLLHLHCVGHHLEEIAGHHGRHAP